MMRALRSSPALLGAAAACLALGLAVVPGARSLAADAEAGRAKSQTCAPCHGDHGISRAPDAPHLAGQPERYVAEQLRAYRGGQRMHPVMNVVAKGLSDADVADLAAWYASIEIEARPR
jgi:cytochrome c553